MSPVTGEQPCAHDKSQTCPVAEHVVTDSKMLATIEAREGKMLALQKWVLGGLVSVALGFGTLVWAQAADAGSGADKHVTSVEARFVAHEVASAHVHEGQAQAMRSVELTQARQTVMLEQISIRLGTYIPPPMDAGTP